MESVDDTVTIVRKKYTMRTFIYTAYKALHFKQQLALSILTFDAHYRGVDERYIGWGQGVPNIVESDEFMDKNEHTHDSVVELQRKMSHIIICIDLFENIANFMNGLLGQFRINIPRYLYIDSSTPLRWLLSGSKSEVERLRRACIFKHYEIHGNLSRIVTTVEEIIRRTHEDFPHFGKKELEYAILEEVKQHNDLSMYPEIANQAEICMGHEEKIDLNKPYYIDSEARIACTFSDINGSGGLLYETVNFMTVTTIHYPTNKLLDFYHIKRKTLDQKQLAVMTEIVNTTEYIGYNIKPWNDVKDRHPRTPGEQFSKPGMKDFYYFYYKICNFSVLDALLVLSKTKAYFSSSLCRSIHLIEPIKYYPIEENTDLDKITNMAVGMKI